MKAAPFQPEKVLLCLLDHRVRFVLIGGLAAAIHGYPGITQDFDICYARDRQNLKRLAAALTEMKAALRGVDEDVPFVLDAGSLALGDSFTFVTRFGDVDCLATPSGTSGFDDLNAGATDEGIGVATIRVASLDDLERMKRAAGRPKDRIALEWIRGIRSEIEGAS